MSPHLILLMERMLHQRGAGYNRLFTLWKVAEEGSCYAAARWFGQQDCSQVTKKLRTLGRELGVDVIESDFNCTEITDFGWDIVEFIRPHFESPGGEALQG